MNFCLAKTGLFPRIGAQLGTGPQLGLSRGPTDAICLGDTLFHWRPRPSLHGCQGDRK